MGPSSTTAPGICLAHFYNHHPILLRDTYPCSGSRGLLPRIYRIGTIWKRRKRISSISRVFHDLFGARELLPSLFVSQGRGVSMIPNCFRWLADIILVSLSLLAVRKLSIYKHLPRCIAASKFGIAKSGFLYVPRC